MKITKTELVQLIKEEATKLANYDAMFNLAEKVYDMVDYNDLANKKKIQDALKKLGHSANILNVNNMIRFIQKELK